MRLFHFLSAKYALQALEHQRLKVALINDLNDPFELFCPDMRDKKARMALREVKRRIAAKIGFLCFCRTWQNLLLWSHYADRHRGAALEVEVDDDHAMPVTYTETRVEWDAREIMLNGGFTQEHADVLGTTKSDHWRYEHEVRVAVPIEHEAPDENGLYFSPVSIKGIVLGSCSKLTNSDISRALSEGQSVTVTQARLAFGKFDIVHRKDVPIATVDGQNAGKPA